MLIVGLGNPGQEYAYTRHNAGFRFLDYLAAKLGFDFYNPGWPAEVGRIEFCQSEIFLVKPQTYMNVSGLAVAQAVEIWHVSTDEIIVIHDDLDLPLGRVKIAVKRGAAGHKGIISIVEHLGTNDFIRIRVGVGRPATAEEEVVDYVLAPFSKTEEEALPGVWGKVEEAMRLIISEGLVMAMNSINSPG